MARTIYTNYSKFTNVVGAKDVLAKIRTFAIANGWVSNYYHTSVRWLADGDGTYSYAHAGDDDVLELESSGYGGMTLVYRFKAYNYDGVSDRLEVYGIDPNNTTINESSPTEPQQQNDFNYITQYYNSMPNSSFPEMCVIGNANIIGVHFRYNTIFCTFLAFGTPELIPEEQGETEFNFIWLTSNTTGTNWSVVSGPGDAAAWYTPFQNSNRNYYMDSAYNYVDQSFAQIVVNYNEAWTDRWTQRQDLLAVNAFSGYRTLVSVPWFRKNQSTNVWRCVGHCPVYYLKWPGLTWGEVITRGVEQYLVFPMLFTTQSNGVAWRIV